MLKKSLRTFLVTSALCSVSLMSASAGENSYKSIVEKDPESSYVFLFVMRSAAFLDWSNPAALTRTNVNSIIAKRSQNPDVSTIGHAQVAWHCNDGGKVVSGATGQSGQSNGQGLDVVLEGWGLSVLDMVFPDGELETEQQVIERTKAADKFNNFAWVGFRVKKDSCMKMADFIKTYDEKKAYVNYGFPVDPLKYEGAGCTSFANASLSFIDPKLEKLSEAWVRHVKLPAKYMGKLANSPNLSIPLEKANSPEEEKKIPVTEFLFAADRWAKYSEEGKDFYYYDPELFFESVVHLENHYRAKAGMRLKDPLRTDDYDIAQKNSKVVSEGWMENILNSPGRVKIEKIYSSTGLLIDL